MSKDTAPKHVAIIMDGNGRWATQRGLPRIIGHKMGAKAVRKCVEFSGQNNIEVLTLFALSVENLLYRPPKEVEFLLQLFSENLQEELPDLHKNNVRVRIIGNRKGLTSQLQQQIHKAEKLTQHNTGLILVLAINYSGRWDITEATAKIADQIAKKLLKPEDVDEDLINSLLSLADLPPPDLLIRTSDEQRISNFLLWQTAYTELYFTETLWPDFDEISFAKAMENFAKRDRRYGRANEQVEPEHV